MPDWVIILGVTLGYLLASLLVGLASGGEASKTTEGYVAGDRSLGFVILYFIMGASIFSAFAFLGGPGWAYSRGAAAFYILAYGTVGLVPWYFFGPRIARLGRRRGYVTQAELFADRFQSAGLSGLLAVVSLVGFIPYLMLQMTGAGYVFSVVTGGRMPVWAGALLAYGVVLIYVFRSGVMGVGWTNTFQGIFMMALAWGLGLYLPHRLYGGVGPMFDAIAKAAPKMLQAPGLGADGHPWSWGAYSSAVAISVLGFGVWPHTFMKIYTARSERTLKRTIVWYPTFQMFLVPILFIGFSGVLAFPGVHPADKILPTVVTSIGLPPVVVGLFCAGALAASMSTGDALLHAAASVTIKDLWRPLFRPDLAGDRERRLIQGLVILIGALAYTLAIFAHMSLVALLLLSYGFIAQFFPLLCATFLWPRATRAGAVAGLLAGFVVTVIWNFVPVLQWQGIRAGIWGVAANVIVMVVVSLATPPMDETHVAAFVVS
ncbi:MAG: sodium:solute symporter family protein [Candidatus Palauibacterales bacterium]|nr:sodium:solute symporter family protein [Candidatus Palauibacterales bacterium]MDP2529086.1 sodium:solute symporter family protein [Candidatus Palauibacterales bacterium]MDP2584290.1 sodium:solute symporter family protein [Candidatus Palauibacterales bacterium]